MGLQRTSSNSCSSSTGGFTPRSLSHLQKMHSKVFQFFSGYRNSREMGLVAWVLGHAVDASSQGDFRLTKEILALLLVAVEQSVTDRGDGP